MLNLSEDEKEYIRLCLGYYAACQTITSQEADQATICESEEYVDVTIPQLEELLLRIDIVELLKKLA